MVAALACSSKAWHHYLVPYFWSCTYFLEITTGNVCLLRKINLHFANLVRLWFHISGWIPYQLYNSTSCYSAFVAVIDVVLNGGQCLFLTAYVHC